MSQKTIVLLHGLFGSRRILWHEYFRGVKELYLRAGFRVIVPKVPPVSNIEIQAQSLEKQLIHETTPLHFVAHSMGGIYARYYITHLDGYKKVQSLTTLASPHRGSPAADYISQNFFFARLLDGLNALTAEHMATFNKQTPDMPDIYYRSYTASRPLEEIPWVTAKIARIVQAAEGANDTQVSVASALWGEHVRTLHADHFEIIGLDAWLNPFTKRVAFKHLPLDQEIGNWIDATFVNHTTS
ncbi:MAG: alpha/beta fold hydrolase [Mariprofundaceae bacterium]|nr:alpha/beta fold hydrolase [Mariprofundaceae bacterium]